ncbi:MAG TPA: DUF5665 domain-containing protein [Planctomycetota bacterium]|nr:DUF5665 domain-containing protein [Planctomycetota bacterium]
MARKDKAKPTRQQVETHVAQQASELAALSELLGSRWKLMWINFMAGLARGVGFFLGASLVGALLLGMLATVFDTTAERLGFKDMTLKDLVRATVVKFEELRQDVKESEADLREKAREEPPAGSSDH